MNIDFHYYGTYVAARLAGYDFASAQIIAHSAQYVDDSSDNMLKDGMGNYYIKTFTPIPTVQGNIEIFFDINFRWAEDTLNKTVDVWVPFHFLPGNYGDNQVIQKYTGPTQDEGEFFSWFFDSESEKQFKLLCQPNSLIVKTMVNDVVMNHTDKDYTLNMAGMRMHVLADTWAHMFYVGLPAWFVNDANDDVYQISGTTKTPVKWQRIWPWDDSTDILNGEQATPNALAYNSAVYLGHGRMGHLPDYPYLKYQYTPRWSKDTITKDNTSYFMQAIRQLTKALSCIKNKTLFDINSYADLPTDVEDVIKNILSTRVNDQSDTWKKQIPQIKINGVPLEVPADYDKNIWLNTYIKTPVNTTDYYRFNYSAVKHLLLVRDCLAEWNIYFDSTPKEDIVSTKFKNKKSMSIGPIDDNYPNQFYPKMADQGINLQIIKQTPKPLSSGDVVEIKTLESAVDVYNFLGAWLRTSLYYYTRQFDISKQKWQVEKVYQSKDLVIRAGDQVRFKNVNYSNKPYMCTYEYTFGGTYLTTQQNGSSDNAIWIMDGLSEFDIRFVTPDYFISDIIDLTLSSSIQNDMKIYGLIISDKNDVDVRALKKALDTIYPGFIHAMLTPDQQNQVYIQLRKIVNY